MTFSVELPGPWRHEYVSANGARFHVAAAGPSGRASATPVVLVHGFPQFWWAWRHQLAALAEAGHPAYAVDLRGYGGSDKTPRGYDPFTLAADIAGVIRGLGLADATLVGHGWGGFIAWTVATLHDEVVARIATISAPHPRAMLRSSWRGGPLVTHVLAMQPPWRPERVIRTPAYLRQHLRTWAGRSSYPSEDEVETYAGAMANWPSPHCAIEYHRWLFRSRLRSDGRRFNAAMRTKCRVPAYVLRGSADPAMHSELFATTNRYAAAPVVVEEIPGAGHFAPEEAPEAVSDRLLTWLRRSPAY